MYLLNTELTINWRIPATLFTYELTNWDIVLKAPNGDQTYIDAAILIADYTAPTPLTDGWVTYRFTPNTVGLWVAALTTGLGSLHYLYYDYKLQIVTNDTFSQQYVESASLENLP